MRRKINIQFAILFMTLLCATQVFSQGAYISFYGGYGLQAAPTPYIASIDINQNNSNQITTIYSVVKGTGSFGKGIQAGAAFGYMFNENIGAELGLGYLFGADLTSNSTSSYISPYPYTQYTEASSSGTMLRLTPAIKLTMGKGKVKPYTRFGLVVGISPKAIETLSDKIKSTQSPQTYYAEGKYSGGVPIGFSGALGADVKLSAKISFFCEFIIIAQSWAPKKYEITTLTVNGINKLTDVSTYYKETEFVDSYTVTTGPVNSNAPKQELKTFLPFSSAGINVGMHFALGKKK